MEQDKYILLKNLIHNELGVTKSDIRCWVKEAVDDVISQELKNYINQNNFQKMVNDKITRAVNEAMVGYAQPYEQQQKVKDKIARVISDNVLSNLDIQISMKKQVIAEGVKCDE